MSTQIVDLRSGSVCDRVERARAGSRAMRVALALVLVGTGAAGAAEAVRSDAHARLDAATARAERAGNARHLRGRMCAEQARLFTAIADRERIPMARILALVTSALPEGGYIRSIRFSEEAATLTVSATIADAALHECLAAVRAAAPWIDAHADGSRLVLSVSRDCPFEIVDAEGTADAR